MQDGIQGALQALATQNTVTRDIAIICAAALIYVLGLAWLVVVLWQCARLTRAALARTVLLGLGAYLVAQVLTGLVSDPRPYLVAHVAPLVPVARDNGFPSDHTLMAAVLTASLWWIDRRWLPTYAGLTLLVLLGRLAVGAHHTLDVVASVAIVIVVTVLISALRLPMAWQRPLLAPRAHAARDEPSAS